MDIKSAERYAVARSVIDEFPVRVGGSYAIAMSVIEQVMVNHQPGTGLSKREATELAVNPQARFERLWELGGSLLEVDENLGGLVEGRGRVLSGIPLSVRLTFRHEAAGSGRFLTVRDIEAQWSAQWSYKGLKTRLGPAEVIKETETQLNDWDNKTLSDDSMRRLLLVEQSIIACRALRSLHADVTQPAPVVFKAA